MEKINSAKQELENYFKAMQQSLFTYNISFKEFEEYYNNLNNAITKMLLDDYFSYALALSSSFVIIINKDEEVRYSEYINNLKDIVAKSIRSHLDKNGINIAESLNGLQNYAGKYTISLSRFCEYCDQLKLAMMAKFDKEECLKWVRILQNVSIETPKGYDETVKLYSYQKLIAKYHIQLAQLTESNLIEENNNNRTI